jgi:hypothetical protein
MIIRKLKITKYILLRHVLFIVDIVMMIIINYKPMLYYTLLKYCKRIYNEYFINNVVVTMSYTLLFFLFYVYTIYIYIYIYICVCVCILYGMKISTETIASRYVFKFESIVRSHKYLSARIR